MYIHQAYILSVSVEGLELGRESAQVDNESINTKS